MAYAIYESKIPVVSAVGHETDFTICDFVSDLRAPTPSAAAELVYPSETEILSKLDTYNIRIKTNILNRVARRREYLEIIQKGLQKTPRDIIAKYRLMTDNLVKNLESYVNKIVTKRKMDFEKQLALLDSLSPLKTMSRGYSVVTNEKDKLVTKTSDVTIGDKLNIKVTDGIVATKVESVGGM